MMRCIVFLCFCLLCRTAWAQETCNCSENLQQYIRHVSQNYSGFADKVHAATIGAYTQLVDSLQEAAQHAADPKACFGLLDRYRGFFYDKHLILGTDLALDKPLPYGLKNGVLQTTKWTVPALHQYLRRNPKVLKPLEGIWASEDTRVAVVYEPAKRVYQGIVLEAASPGRKPGSLLFVSKPIWSGEFQTYFREEAGRWEETHSETAQDVLVHAYYGIWRKKFPALTEALPDDAILARFGDVRMQLLDSSTLYIRLKSCALENKAALESYLEQYKQQLPRVQDWIIDLRTNTGGSTLVFEPLEPYLYTRTFIGRGDRFWATPAHTAAYQGFLSQNDAHLSETAKAVLMRRVAFGQAYPNQWLIEQGDTVQYEQVYDYPRRVAILSSRENASAGESFLIRAKGMSSKVTVFGAPSAGYLDYGDIMDFSLPCAHYSIRIPSRRANYIDDGIHYDRTGFPPDVPVPQGTADWIGFVRKYWSRQAAARP